MLQLYPDSTSTVSNPIRYFDALFSSNLLTLKKEGFLANEFISEGDNQTSEIIYDEDFPVTDMGFVIVDPSYKYFKVDNWFPSAKISFEEMISEQIQEEFHKSTGLIDLLFEQQISIDTVKLKCLLLLYRLQFLLGNVMTDEQFKEFPEFREPIEGLIRFLLKKYPSFCPKYSKAHDFYKIKSKKWEPEKITYGRELSNSIFNDLIDFEDLKGNCIFDLEGSREELIRDLKYLFYGSFNKINNNIYFSCQAGPAHYIIRLLKGYFLVTLDEIEESHRVFINKIPFVADNSSPAASKFSGSPNQTDLRDKIDDLFKKHLK